MTERSAVTVIVGLPGSGKSFLVAELKAVDPDLVEADDFHSSSVDDSPLPEASRYAAKIRTAVGEGRGVVISDIALCEWPRRTMLTTWLKTLSPQPEVTWIFFENDLQQCLLNVEGRPGRDAERDAAAARTFSPTYLPPGDTRPVYKSPEGRSPAPSAT